MRRSHRLRARVVIIGLLLALAAGITPGPANATTATPSVSRLLPYLGAPGTMVRIRGTNLSGSTAVSIGGIVVAPSVVIGGSEIEVTVPASLAPGVVTVDVSNAGGPTMTATFRVLLPLTINPITLSPVESGQELWVQLTGSGGRPAYKFSSASPLPAGLSLTTSGLLTGRPLQPGQTTIDFTVTDLNHLVVNRTATLLVTQGPVITTSSLPAGAAGNSYFAQLGAADGTPPYTWSIASGPLPGGMILTSGGNLEGIPGLAGNAIINLEATDAIGAVTEIGLPISIAPPPPPAQTLVLATAASRLYTLASVDAQPPFAVISSARQAGGKAAGIASGPGGRGYWLVNSFGQVTAFDGAKNYGSVGRHHLIGRIVAIAADPFDTGYWLLSTTGRVYGFGSARTKGSLRSKAATYRNEKKGASHRNSRAVGIAPAPIGLGYWILQASGQVTAFGTARHLRSKPETLALKREMHGATGIASIPVGAEISGSQYGYWITTGNGRVFGFGAATFSGSLFHRRGVGRTVAIAATPSGNGYWLVTGGGTIAPFGDARTLPSSQALPTGGVIGIASAP